MTGNITLPNTIELTELERLVLQRVLSRVTPEPKRRGRPPGTRDSEITRLKKSLAQRARYADPEQRQLTREAVLKSLKPQQEPPAAAALPRPAFTSKVGQQQLEETMRRFHEVRAAARETVARGRQRRAAKGESASA